MPLIECIPNFSEGREPEVIHAIVDAIQRVKNVILLDVSTDSDHNRTVVTFAGEPDVVGEAAFRGIAKAAELIDLEAHRGEHPRMGAADVVPFVPLRGASIADCVAVAEQVGERVGRELELPVYLYESAARIPARRNLADVRRPRYEGLQALIADDPAWMPDFGPRRLSPAGAVVMGARAPLIAFNAFLDTDDVRVAQAVAQAVRGSSGGLPFLKALGLSVAGQAQVSMNVIDYQQTGLHPILEAVRREAEKRGHRVTHTEVVGLIPRAALIDAALAYLGLPPTPDALVLEDRLGAETGDFRPLTYGVTDE